MTHDRDSLTLEEIAEMYVVGGLSPAEHDRFRRMVDSGDPDAVLALREAAGAGDALAKLVKPEAPPHVVRRKLMSRVESLRAGEEQVWRSWGTGDSESVFTLRSDEGDWDETGVDGVQVRRLFVDRGSNRMTCMFRMAAGTSYPSHVHDGAEECYVLQGDLHVGDIVMHAGDYQRAPGGSLHGVQSTEGGCLLLVTTSLSDEMT